MLRRCKERSRASLRAFACGTACGWVCAVAIIAGTAFAAGQKTAAPPRSEREQAASPNANARLIPPQEFSRAQAAAQKILAGAEFQREQPTLWDRIKEKIGEALVRAFVGIDRVTTAAPWMARALEWLLFLAAAVGLLVWGLRVVQRQRLRVALGGTPLRTAERARERDDWRQLAEEEAARGAWREAIHAMYWAAIVHLENRRAWRHNPARTPREYVRLLKPGSAEQMELRGLTRALEKSWYGHDESREEEYRAARESFGRIAEREESLPGGAEAAAMNAGAGHAGGNA
ncbi:MAG TPA: DUF4129 domain-containing protein [Candidatus Aquilonibacter sp.]|nr:DUF4129 domain-containing protein [Candidatus Aquilonibacter sp.]